MDGGFRGPRPTERQVVNRTQPTYQHQQAGPSPAPTPDTPRIVRQPSVAPQRVKSSKRFFWPVIIAVIVIILAGVGWFTWSKLQGGTVGIESNRYQAVFFTNGQVYFGKLHTLNDKYMKLTDIYYLQTQANSDGSSSDNPQKTSANQNDVQLIKLGDEIHGPEDEMVISRDQLLFFENLKTTSKVVQSIAKYKSGH